MSLSMRNYRVLSELAFWQPSNDLQDNNSLFVNMPRSRLTTTPRRLRNNAHRRSLVQTPGVSPRSVKKLRVDMLRGYLASYQLPTTGSKQQLAERLTKHLRTMATKKNKRPCGRPAKATCTKAHRTQSDAPPTEPSPLESSDSSADEEVADTPPTDPSPLESSDSSAGEEEVGSQDSPSGDEASSQRPLSGGQRSKHHRHRTSSANQHSDDQVSGRRARRRHTSHSRKSHRRARSTASESEASPPRRKRRRHRDSSLSSSSSTSSISSSSRRRRRHRRRHHTRHRRHHIKQGKYVNFDKFLLPLHTPPLFTGNQNPSKQHKTQKYQITDLNSWLEAWNRNATCRIASDPRKVQ